MAFIFNPTIGAELSVSETEIYSGTSPTSWTELDTGIGESALVLLKIASTNTLGYVSVRKNGDTDEFYSTSSYAPAAGRGKPVPSVHEIFICATDGAGLIEWIAENAVAATTVDVIAYLS